MVREPAGAGEVTQDAFVRAYTHIDRYDDHRPFYPWLATRPHRTRVARRRNDHAAAADGAARLLGDWDPPRVNRRPVGAPLGK
jgi:DNA-directed RNA polymerase specialized sigma24 family protein